MRIETLLSRKDIHQDFKKPAAVKADLVFYFLSPDYPCKDEYLGALKRRYPNAVLMGCTTGGEIADDQAVQGSAVSSAIQLKHTKIRIAKTQIAQHADSFEAGKMLASELRDPSLRLMFVLSDGLKVNGSELVRGMTTLLDEKVIITGGLAGDGPHFKHTGVGINTLPESGVVAAVGLYGDKLNVTYGSVGGWMKFGPERQITRSKSNILYELDGKPALELYKKYLGEEANKLPGSGLLFPLSIYPPGDSSHDIVRTIVGINEEENSLIFAGDVPEGYIAQLMRGNTNNLVDGAVQAAQYARNEKTRAAAEDTLGILVSCIGRNLLMGQYVSDEVEAIKQVLGDVSLVGFYSYGEICHHPVTRRCGLHNQTMTITLLSEAA